MGGGSAWVGGWTDGGALVHAGCLVGSTHHRSRSAPSTVCLSAGARSNGHCCQPSCMLLLNHPHPQTQAPNPNPLQALLELGILPTCLLLLVHPSTRTPTHLGCRRF